MYIAIVDCEFYSGCSDKATKSVTITFDGGKCSDTNLCNTYVVESKKDFIELQKDPCRVHVYTFVVKDLS